MRSATPYSSFLSRMPLFLNTSSDARLLPLVIDAAREVGASPPVTTLEADAAAHGMEPLFVRGVAEGI